MAVPVHASTRGVGLRMPHIAAHCTILSTSEAPAHSRARVSGFDDSSEEILGGGRAGARPETEHASRRTRHLFFCFVFFVFLFFFIKKVTRNGTSETTYLNLYLISM